MRHAGEIESISAFPALSKRAARRLIQRALVLTGRLRNIRHHLRDANLSTLWVIEDWGIAWTVILHRGRIEYERRPVKKPDLTLAWETAGDFFAEIRSATPAEQALRRFDDPAVRKLVGPFYEAFRAFFCALLDNPVDDDGYRLF